MRNFKAFLLEYLTDTQRDRYKDVHMTDKARADTDHFFGAGNDKIHGEITHDDKSEIHKQLENHLGQEISHEDYAKGTIKDRHNRDVKIGRLIKDNDLRIQFDKDPARSIGKAPTLKTTTVRGVEVAGQTNSTPNAQHPKGHSWGGISCKNVDDGVNKRYLKSEIKHGTVVHFAHDQNGQEIYRATLQPHHNQNGDVAYAVDAEYGIKHPKFTEDANRVAKELSGKYKPGTFEKHPKVYNDSGEVHMQHPGATSEDIHHILKHGTQDEKHEVMRHKFVNADHISYVLDHEHDDPALKAIALRRPAVNDEHIMKGLNDPVTLVKRVAVSNALKPEHVTRAIQLDQPAEIRREAIRDSSATTDHISHVIKSDPDIDVVRQAIAHYKINKDHITAALKRPESELRWAAIRSKHVTPEHIETAIHDDDDNVVSVAARHPLAKPEHISHILSHGHEGALYAALDPESNATSEHIHHIIHSNDPRFNRDIKITAAMHPNASSEDIMHAIKHGDANMHYDMAHNSNVNAEHISHMLNQGDDSVMSAISRRDDLTPEHIGHILKHGREHQRRNVIFRPNMSHENMEHVIKHEPVQSVRANIFARSDIPSHLVSHTIRHDPDDYVRYQAITHPNATPEDLAHAAMHDEDNMNKVSAIHQKNTPIYAIQHVANKYKGEALGRAALRELDIRK